MCNNANERCYIDLLYYSRKYSHILAYNDNIMTNTKLHILAIVTCRADLENCGWGNRVCISKGEALDRGTRYRAGVGMGGMCPPSLYVEEN